MKHARPLLRPEFLNGLFGDPALGIWVENEHNGLLVDCGDLSRFSPKQLLKVNAIFLSHCHMDHIFGFDTFLKVHIGLEKTVSIFGPPDTSARISGKLQGYTWNLIDDDKTQFVVTDLDPSAQSKTTTYFRAQDRFHPSDRETESWDPAQSIYATEVYAVKTTLLDHRTPSLAYAIEEQLTFALNAQRTLSLGIKTGPWINKFKKGKMENAVLEVPLLDGTTKNFDTSFLKNEILDPRPRQKIAYVTDGATSAKNRHALFNLIQNADIMFSETCFLPTDQKLADQTKHFTTEFIGKLAQEAGVKKLAPFHFSKRYQDRPKELFTSISEHFHGEIIICQ
ncbi:MAG: MBL fold metallo-hydrolase [Bdellovibrionia bacterium]